MSEDVTAALERFQNFTGRFSDDWVIDEQSGFTFGDAMLLIGEVESARMEPVDENPID